MRGGTSLSGEPVWIVLDPIRNRFFRITFEMVPALVALERRALLRVSFRWCITKFGRLPEQEEIYAAMRTLERSFFVTEPASATWRALHAGATHRHSLFMRLIHNYLFFRIPLVRPDRFIRKTAPYVSRCSSAPFSRLSPSAPPCLGSIWFPAMGCLHRYLSLCIHAGRHRGSVVSIVVIKVDARAWLFTAYVAHRRCRVPTMGIAFMVLVPLLYTDVSDAWRLKSRFDRLKIDMAAC